MKSLLSPLGLSPGLLYSALMQLKPEKTLILTSEAAGACLPDIYRQAGYIGIQEVILIADPFLAFDQWERIKPMVDSISATDEVWVNITGGTTALQYLMQKAANYLAGCGRTVWTVALIDRRGVLLQKEKPYEVGEMVVLAEKIEEG